MIQWQFGANRIAAVHIAPSDETMACFRETVQDNIEQSRGNDQQADAANEIQDELVHRRKISLRYFEKKEKNSNCAPMQYEWTNEREFMWESKIVSLRWRLFVQWQGKMIVIFTDMFVHFFQLTL